MAFIWGLWCATEDIPEHMVVMVTWVMHYENLRVLELKEVTKIFSFIVVKPAG